MPNTVSKKGARGAAAAKGNGKKDRKQRLTQAELMGLQKGERPSIRDDPMCSLEVRQRLPLERVLSLAQYRRVMNERAMAIKANQPELTDMKISFDGRAVRRLYTITTDDMIGMLGTVGQTTAIAKRKGSKVSDLDAGMEAHKMISRSIMPAHMKA